MRNVWYELIVVVVSFQQQFAQKKKSENIFFVFDV